MFDFHKLQSEIWFCEFYRFCIQEKWNNVGIVHFPVRHNNIVLVFTEIPPKMNFQNVIENIGCCHKPQAADCVRMLTILFIMHNAHSNDDVRIHLQNYFQFSFDLIRSKCFIVIFPLFPKSIQINNFFSLLHVFVIVCA